MSESDRRRTERHKAVLPVSVTIAGPIEINGQSLDISSYGLLLTAPGQISVQVVVEGKQYRGRLVRSFPMGSGATAYGIELEEALESTETESQQKVE